MNPEFPKPAIVPQPGESTSAEDVCRFWYTTYSGEVYNYLRFHLPSADTAEDIMAETFLKVFRSAATFDPSRASARVWIFSIARNTLHDFARRARVRRHVSLGALRDLACDAPSPEERLIWEEEVAGVLEAVALLEEGDREMISLRYGSNLSVAMIAEVLAIREPTVRTRLWRALKRLRARLPEDT
ncbi:MAG: sigma-70 family RNA polymerase sigma factor [Gemmatimonadota bacterium]